MHCLTCTGIYHVQQQLAAPELFSSFNLLNGSEPHFVHGRIQGCLLCWPSPTVTREENTEEEEREQENTENSEQGEWEKRGGRERTREYREQGTGRVGERRRKRENKRIERTGNR